MVGVSYSLDRRLATQLDSTDFEGQINSLVSFYSTGSLVSSWLCVMARL
jgi:hypothetical protein